MKIDDLKWHKGGEIKGKDWNCLINYIKILGKRIDKLEKKVKEIDELECPYDIKIRKGLEKKK